MKLNILMCVLLCFGSAVAQKTQDPVKEKAVQELQNEAAVLPIILVSEKTLGAYLDELSPEILQSRLQSDQAVVSALEFNDQFKAKLYGSLQYRVSNEEPFIAFQPVISPMSIAKVGVKQKLKYGLTADASVGIDNREFDLSGVPQEPSIATFNAQVSMDLWKNFLGKLDRLQALGLQSMHHQARLKEQMSKHAFWIRLRSLYWNAVVLQMQVDIAENMKKLAYRQESQARKRFKESVADKAELSFYASQKTTRANDVLTLKFQKQQQLNAIYSLLPQLSDKIIHVHMPDTETTIDQVLNCVEVIQKTQEPVMDHTLYDELLKEVQIMHASQRKLKESYADMDISLDAQAFAIAVDDDAEQALGEALAKNRKGWALGLNVEVPFGKKDTQRKQVRLQEQQARKDITDIQQQMLTSYRFVKESIPLLVESIQNERLNLRNLNSRSREIDKKFKQGRLSISDYMTDRDNLLRAELGILASKNVIIQTMLNYLSVFSLSPCAFNEVYPS